MRSVEDIEAAIAALEQERATLMKRASELEQERHAVLARALAIRGNYGSGKVVELRIELNAVREAQEWARYVKIPRSPRFAVTACRAKSADVKSVSGSVFRVTGRTEFPATLAECHAAWIAAGRTVGK